MTNNKKILIGVLTLVGIVGAGVYGANAYQGDYSKHGPNYTEERHNEMTKIFENNDYNAWKNEMEEHMKERGGHKGRVLEVVNKDNFSKFAEAHKLGEAGDKVGADKIRAELGLRTSAGKGGGHGNCGNEKGRDGEHRKDGEHREGHRGGHFEDKDYNGRQNDIR